MLELAVDSLSCMLAASISNQLKLLVVGSRS